MLKRLNLQGDPFVDDQYITQGPDIPVIKDILDHIGPDESQFWMVMPSPWRFEFINSGRKFTVLAQKITHNLALIQFEDDQQQIEMDWRDILLNARCLSVEG